MGKDRVEGRGEGAVKKGGKRDSEIEGKRGREEKERRGGVEEDRLRERGREGKREREVKKRKNFRRGGEERWKRK
jgi:hypothetical protein